MGAVAAVLSEQDFPVFVQQMGLCILLCLFQAGSLGLAPAECIVVEDAPSGIRAAHAAGIQAIGLATSFPAEYLREQAQPDYLLPDLKSILTML